MKKFVPVFIVIGLVALAAILYFVLFTESASDETVNDTSVNNQTSAPAPSADNDQPASIDQPNSGYYISYADYQADTGMYNDGKIVYFFNASWCPTCKALDNDIKQNSANIPVGVAIVSVDYDDNTDLRKQYGVTTQHTLVQVDTNGGQVNKWSGGNTLDSVLQQI